MTLVPLTKDKRIDTDECFEIRLCDLDADYVFDENDVRQALLGAIHECKPKDGFHWYVPLSVLKKSFPVFFEYNNKE